MAGSSPRNSKESLIIIHTGEGILNRHDMADFLDRSDSASAHAACDSGGVVAPLVPYSRAAWTAGPTANSRGIQIELCAFAAMTRAQWLSKEDIVIWIPWLNANRTIKSPYSMLHHAANWAKSVAQQYGIPKQKISASQLRAGASGICGHADVSEAWRETDHTDPGSGFPWDVFINLVNGNEGGPELDSTERGKLEDLHEWMLSMYSFGWAPVPGNITRTGRRHTGGNLNWFDSKIKGVVQAELKPVLDEVKALNAKLSALGTGTGYSLQELAKAINDDADARDRDGNPTTGRPAENS